MLGAPRGERAGIGIGIARGADEGEVEEDGRERDEEGDDQVLEVAAGHGDRYSCVASGNGWMEVLCLCRWNTGGAMEFIAELPINTVAAHCCQVNDWWRNIYV